MQEINGLVSLDLKERDHAWEESFLRHLPSCQVQLLSEAPQQGPDGWPYMMVALNPNSKTHVLDVLSWLSDRGIGLVINPHKEAPDYVLTYGMIWNFFERKEFISKQQNKPQLGQIKIESGRKLMAGAPSEEYFPTYARKIMRTFLKDNGFSDPKILVMSQDEINFDLCFSLDSLGNPPPTEHRGILEALSWFMPQHYSLMLIAEQGLPPFHSL